LKPGEKGLSENIEVKRIVDRFLEHSRIFIFGENGSSKVYMGSSDWMTRNLHHRIEVCVPVKDPSLADELKNYFTIQWNDDGKSGPVEPFLQRNNQHLNGKEVKCSQREIYSYLKTRT
jgi:polyphosphate kinase